MTLLHFHLVQFSSAPLLLQLLNTNTHQPLDLSDIWDIRARAALEKSPALKSPQASVHNAQKGIIKLSFYEETFNQIGQWRISISFRDLAGSLHITPNNPASLSITVHKAL